MSVPGPLRLGSPCLRGESEKRALLGPVKWLIDLLDELLGREDLGQAIEVLHAREELGDEVGALVRGQSRSG